MNHYERQEIDPDTGALDGLAEADARSAREAAPDLLRRAGSAPREAMRVGDLRSHGTMGAFRSSPLPGT